MKIEQRDINKIFPYPNNPRKNDKAVEKVAMSLEEFGWQQPIVVDPAGVIIVGHTRWLAARSLGMDKCPVVVADKMTPEQGRAYRIADNRTGELAEWDNDLLDLEIQELIVSDFDLELTGFDMFDLGFNDKDKQKDREREWVQENFMVVVECETEEEQLLLLEKFQEEGLKCKALIS